MAFEGKAEFSAIFTPVSHDPSEIILICWFGAQEIFLIIIKIRKVLWKQWYILPSNILCNK